MDDHRKINVYLVVGGRYFDVDFVRLELLKLLAENERICTRLAEHYHDLDAIRASDFLVTYSGDVAPTEDEQRALRDYVAGGKRWLALHSTNAIIRLLPDGRIDSPEIAPVLMDTLGTQFIAHPPVQKYRVHVADPDHELVRGIDDFETEDEIMLLRIHGKLHTLLETRYTGAAERFVEDQWPVDEARPLYYINKVGLGEVIYLALGHTRGHYDLLPLGKLYLPDVDRGSWQQPQYYELLRRAIRYCAERIGQS